MLKQVHDHIVHELQQNARTDTIFVVTAIVFNLIVLAINSAVAGQAASDYSESSSDFILVAFILMSMMVNAIAVMALNAGKRSREKLLKGLLSMYQDNDVAKYYDPSLVTGYKTRYMLFTGVIICLAVTSIVVPMIIRFM